MEKKKKEPIEVINENNKKGKTTTVILNEGQIKKIIEQLKKEIMK